MSKVFNISTLCVRLLLLALCVVECPVTSGLHLGVKLENQTGQQNDQVCSQNFECILESELCDIAYLESVNIQECILQNHTLSSSFCCPVEKIIRSEAIRYQRKFANNEESELDNVAEKTPIKILREEQECGQNFKSLSTDTSVRNARGNDWPWMAVLLDRTTYFNFCGGVILNRQFILTAAHCLEKYTSSQLIVRLGEYDLDTFNDTQHRDFVVRDIIRHPDYDRRLHHNDIAILMLDVPTDYSMFIRPICLPKFNMNVTNKLAIVTGWGQITYGGKFSSVLHEVEIPVWEQSKCVAAFSRPILETNICAAGYEGGKDACLGDSGSPLMIQRLDGKWTNIGIVSWGIGCGNPMFPGVYTRVASYLKWIAVTVQYED